MYVLEAHGEVIRSKLSSNQSRYLDIIVTHQNKHYSPRFRVCIFFTSTLSKKNKNLYCLEFLVGPSPFIQLWSLSMFRQLLNTHMRDWAFWRWRSVCRSVLYPTTSSHWAKLKPSNTTQNKRSKCRIIEQHAKTYPKHIQTPFLMDKQHKAPYKKQKFGSRT